MNLRTGILGESDGWKEILRQEGVPYERVQADPIPEAYAAIVVNEKADDRELGAARQYLRGGGSILCSAKTFATLKGTTYGRRPIDHVFGRGESLFAPAGLVDIGMEGVVAWSANELPCQDGTPTAYVGPLEDGHCIALPFDPSVLVTSSDAVRKSFYGPGKRLPFERVSRVNKNGVRRIVRLALQKLYAFRGLPFAHLWYYPDDAQSAFILRIDTDYSTQNEIEHLYEFLREREIPGSWFVDVKSQEGGLGRFAKMQGQEVGIHCYEHRTFEEETRNHENILKARERFRDASLGALGYAAPYGIWNPGLGRVLRDFRFEYSSEFAWDYDNLPGEPWIDEKSRGILQIPVHPISIGTLRRQGYAGDALSAYYDRVVDEKLSLDEPLFFYHHPKDRHHDTVGHLISRAKDAGALPMSMRSYAAWWKTRQSEGMNLELRENRILIDLPSAPKEHIIRVVGLDGRMARVPITPAVNLGEVVWKRPPSSYEYPRDLARVRRFNPRIPITLAVDSLFSFRKKRA